MAASKPEGAHKVETVQPLVLPQPKAPGGRAAAAGTGCISQRLNLGMPAELLSCGVTSGRSDLLWLPIPDFAA